MKKFNDGDILTSTLKVYPKVKFFGYNGKIYINNTSDTGIKLNDFLNTPDIPDSLILAENSDILTDEYGQPLIIEEAY